jgi:hypothetical protein
MTTRRPLYLTLTLTLGLVLLAGCSRKPELTDAQVATAVQNQIYGDAAIQSRQIGVQAASGVVTLSGDVASDTERTTAASDAAGVDGVKTVVNNLEVKTASEPPVRQGKPAKTKNEKKRDSATTAHRHGKANNNWANDDLEANNQPPLPEPPPDPAPTPAPAPVQPPPPPQKITVPAGTQISVRLGEALDSERNQVGDTFHGSLTTPIVIGGETVIPSGADVVGRVADVKSAGRFAGNSVLTLELTAVSVNGKTYNIQTNQWSRAGKGEGKNTATKVGVGTAAGAVLGGLIGGGRGAAIGAASGAGAGTGVAAAKKGQQIKLGPEAVLNFQTINTLVVVPQGMNGHNSGRTPLS